VNPEKVKSYLFTTAYHTMIDVLRKEKRQTYMEGYQIPEDVHDEQYSDLKEILNEAVKRLPEIQRTVILLRDYEGYSYKEIGGVTSLSEVQVKVYIYRARVFLKNYIGKMEMVV
jgi:RNA polymerase sigma-70 factor (ECF subfamily)